MFLQNQSLQNVKNFMRKNGKIEPCYCLALVLFDVTVCDEIGLDTTIPYLIGE